ncbi:hypothetical protein GJ629_10080 [Halapricum sp. CBA1109]|uniref:DUF5788 family protein n=1 Tax=Halapricum sp. CBA1109 TaxID=2668068 RepID=UPI0012F918DF|nr:DUF5788 family protein [Halapricum sp. CBA1109]MUV90195.1 hypothetical protein [Halapricum sp. CBA1109]
MPDDGATQLGEKRREELLDRVSRRTATIGQSIPETVEVGEETIELKSFVWETKRQGVVPPEYRERVQSVRSRLKRERDRRKERLAEADLTVAEGERLAQSIVGIDRAITALKSLKEPDLDEHKHEQTVKSNKRWVSFLDQLR